MSYKRLFNDDNSESYNDLTLEIDTKVSNAVMPIMREYINKGYSPRDVMYVACTSIWDVHVSQLMELKCPQPVENKGESDYDEIVPMWSESDINTFKEIQKNSVHPLEIGPISKCHCGTPFPPNMYVDGVDNDGPHYLKCSACGCDSRETSREVNVTEQGAILHWNMLQKEKTIQSGKEVLDMRTGSEVVTTILNREED